MSNSLIPSNCHFPGCSSEAIGGHYCEEHKKKNIDSDTILKKQDAARTKFYNSTNWKRLRKLVLHRQPLCAECESPGCHVDHIVPISQGGSYRAMSNLQVLCASCHSVKTRSEQKKGRV